MRSGWAQTSEWSVMTDTCGNRWVVVNGRAWALINIVGGRIAFMRRKRQRLYPIEATMLSAWLNEET